MDAVLAERRRCQWRDELLRRLGHYDSNRGPTFAQAADQIERFIGGDAPCDDQQDASVGQAGRKKCFCHDAAEYPGLALSQQQGAHFDIMRLARDGKSFATESRRHGKDDHFFDEAGRNSSENGSGNRI